MDKAILLKLINPKWHNDFLSFVKSGDASEAFLRYLEKDNDAQKAAEMAFEAQVETFEKFAGALKDKSFWDKRGQPDLRGRVMAASEDMATIFEEILDLSPDEARGVITQAASSLSDLEQEQREQLKIITQQLADTFSDPEE
jgi:hypothetical protein